MPGKKVLQNWLGALVNKEKPRRQKKEVRIRLAFEVRDHREGGRGSAEIYWAQFGNSTKRPQMSTQIKIVCLSVR